MKLFPRTPLDLIADLLIVLAVVCVILLLVRGCG